MEKEYTEEELMQLSKEEFIAYQLEKKKEYYNSTDLVQDTNYQS